MKKPFASICLLLLFASLAQGNKKEKWSGEVVVEQDGVVETSTRVIDGSEYPHDHITNFIFLPKQGTHLTIVCRTHSNHSKCIPLVKGQQPVLATIDGKKITITTQPRGYNLVKPDTFESTVVDAR